MGGVQPITPKTSERKACWERQLGQLSEDGPLLPGRDWRTTGINFPAKQIGGRDKVNSLITRSMIRGALRVFTY